MRGLSISFVHIILDFIVPAKIKRLIVLSTVYMYLNRKGILLAESDSKLKEYLNSFTNCNSYEFGKMFANSIWDDTVLGQKVDERIQCHRSEGLCNNSIDDLSSIVATATPEWLKYRTDQCKTDIESMIKGSKIALA